MKYSVHIVEIGTSTMYSFIANDQLELTFLLAAAAMSGRHVKVTSVNIWTGVKVESEYNGINS